MEIDLNAPGAFALLCRCGKPQVQCATHEAAVAPDRVLLPAGVEPVHYDVDLTLRLNDHAFDGRSTRSGATAASWVAHWTWGLPQRQSRAKAPGELRSISIFAAGSVLFLGELG